MICKFLFLAHCQTCKIALLNVLLAKQTYVIVSWTYTVGVFLWYCQKKLSQTSSYKLVCILNDQEKKLRQSQIKSPVNFAKFSSLEPELRFQQNKYFFCPELVKHNLKIGYFVNYYTPFNVATEIRLKSSRLENDKENEKFLGYKGQ